MSENTIPLERTANEPVAEGVHLFEIISFTEGEGDKGPYWKFMCECLTEGENSKTVPMFVSLSPAARWRAELFLDAVAAPKKGEVSADKFVGKKFRAQITHELYDGKPQSRIGEMWQVGQKPPTPAAEAPMKVEAALPETKSEEAPAF